MWHRPSANTGDSRRIMLKFHFHRYTQVTEWTPHFTAFPLVFATSYWLSSCFHRLSPSFTAFPRVCLSSSVFHCLGALPTTVTALEQPHETGPTWGFTDPAWRLPPPAAAPGNANGPDLLEGKTHDPPRHTVWPRQPPLENGTELQRAHSWERAHGSSSAVAAEARDAVARSSWAWLCGVAGGGGDDGVPPPVLSELRHADEAARLRAAHRCG